VESGSSTILRLRSWSTVYTREGLVVSDKMNKTITVMVEDRVKHPLYGKVMTKSVRLKAHDDESLTDLAAGRPLSGVLAHTQASLVESGSSTILN
jgi:ribosomal protein S17